MSDSDQNGNTATNQVLDVKTTKILDIETEYDNNRMYLWDKITTDFNQSKELRDQARLTIKEKLKAQHELIVQKIGVSLDVGKKIIFKEYLDAVTEIENSFKNKMDDMDRSNDIYMEEIREQYFNFFDEARKNLEKWKDSPERYKSELTRLNEQQEKRLSNVSRRLNKIEKKREAIFDQTLEMFEREQNVDSIIERFENRKNIY